MTQGRVMKRPPSCGQVWRTGKDDLRGGVDAGNRIFSTGCPILFASFAKRTGSSANLADPIRDLGNLKLGRNLFLDSFQFTGSLQGFNPVAQIVVGQGPAPVQRWPHFNPLA
jgi:hypothetical protein